MPIYRRATSADARALAELRWDFRLAEAGGNARFNKEAFLPVCTEFFETGIRRGDWNYWAAEDDGVLVACVCVHTIAKIPNPNDLHPAFGYVSNVYTRPDYRNQGIGSELMNRAIEWAKEQNFESLILWPSEQSVPFYERAGFMPAEEALVHSLHSDAP